jgi:hypothetical protein
MTRRSDCERALAGFMLSGFLMALLGAILPAWGYHRDPPDFVAVGNDFLSLALGVVAPLVWARRLIVARGLPLVLCLASALASVALLYLSFVPPPYSNWLRAIGLLVLGAAGGSLSLGLFRAISPAYQDDPAGTAVRGGIWYGLGCLTATILVAGTFYAYSVRTILLFMAAIPALFAILYARCNFAPWPESTQPTLGQALRDFRSFGAILMALLLFFQFGNEWAVAGWMPIFLIRRVGMSPEEALFLLAFYWLCLLVGRSIAVTLLPRVRHGTLLLVSVAAALFGCLLLYAAPNGFGAGSGAFFLGCGFASIYPLMAETIGRRFPYYHPGFFNSIFSVAQIGGLLAPASLGYIAYFGGVGVVIGIPLLGTFVVAALLALIWLESKVTGR